MKRLLFLLVGSAVIVAFGGAPAFADNGPHVQHVWTAGTTYTVDNTVGTDRCAGCHRAHTAQGTYLLKQEQPGLCFTCHGSGATGASTDVVDGAGYTSDGQTPDATRAPGGTVGALRGGGFQFALLNSAAPQKEVYLTSTGSLRSKNQHIYALTAGGPTTSAHTVNGTDVTAWGNGAVSATAAYGSTVQLECTSCHDPHGNGNYRILKGIPDQSGTTTAVNIPDATGKVYVTNDYWETGDSNTPAVSVTTTNATTGVTTTTEYDSFTYNIAAWCTTCHTRYLAPSGSYKTDSGDAVYKYRHRSDALKRLPNDGTYADLPTGSTLVKGGGGANCITCHVSHGSNATMGDVSKTVPNPDGTDAYVNTNNGSGATPVLGSSRLLRVDNRGMCLMCHSV
jgi:predicted CXXCH cytochrome family protein